MIASASGNVAGREHECAGEQDGDGTVGDHQRKQRIHAGRRQLHQDVVGDRGDDRERKPDELHEDSLAAPALRGQQRTSNANVYS
jgi:hypothetical protein